MRRRITFTLAVSFTLIGCVTPPSFAPKRVALRIPPGWSEYAAQKPVADTDWIAAFQDSQLQSLVEEALKNNRDLKKAVARVELARGNARLKGAEMLPTLDGVFDSTRAKRNFIGFPNFGGGTSQPSQSDIVSTISESYGVSLDVNWEIDLWGRIRAGTRASLADWQAAGVDYAGARLSLAAQVVKAWLAVIESQQQVELATEARQIHEKTVAVIRSKFERGDDSGGGNQATNLRLALSDLAAAKAVIEERKALHKSAVRQLEILIDHYPHGKLGISRDLPRLPGSPPAGVPAELLERRPDLVAAERRLAAADERVLEAKLTLLPRLSLTGSGGISTEDLQEVLNSDFGVWNLAGNVVQPLFAAGKIKAGYEIRKSERALALADYQATALQAFSEVETALYLTHSLGVRKVALQESLHLAVEADEQARKDYEKGVGDVLTVFTAQRRMIETKGQLLTLRRLQLNNYVNLHLALGGSFYKVKENE